MRRPSSGSLTCPVTIVHETSFDHLGDTLGDL